MSNNLLSHADKLTSLGFHSLFNHIPLGPLMVLIYVHKNNDISTMPYNSMELDLFTGFKCHKVHSNETETLRRLVIFFDFIATTS